MIREETISVTTTGNAGSATGATNSKAAVVGKIRLFAAAFGVGHANR